MATKWPMRSSRQRPTEITGEQRLRRWWPSLPNLLLPAALLALAIGPSLALTPEERLADPELEARARVLSAELRCVVCPNQSIDDSNAPLAQDLRAVVRERLAAGDSNEEALAYITARYGDYVLLRPPVQPNTMLLWGGPVIVLLLGGGIVVWALAHRRPNGEAHDALTPEERRRVDALLSADTKPDMAEPR